MPRRPPKEWWDSAIRELKRNPDISNPRKVAGWIWYHHMNPAAKKAALKREGKNPLLGIDTRRYMKKKNKRTARKTLNALRRAGRKIAHEAGYKPGERFFFGKKRKRKPQHKGGIMAKHHKKHHKAYHGDPGRKHHRRHGRGRSVCVRHVLMGAHEGGLSGIGKILLNGLIAGGGAVGGSFIASKTPIPVKFKPAIPLGIAIILSLMGKKVPMANILALGNAAAAGLGAAKQFFPNLSLLAGVDTYPALEEHEKQALLGAAQLSGDSRVTMGAHYRRPGER
jgi:hypothetical protein